MSTTSAATNAAPPAQETASATDQNLQGRQNTIPLPHIKSVDVQFLTNRNELIGIDSVQDQGSSKQYTFPTGINNIPVPDLKDMNVSFALNDGRRVNVRATPQ